MYINTTTNEYPLSEASIKALYPNTSFPNPFKAPEEFSWVFPSPPTYNTDTERCVETAPALTSKGHWEQQWLIISLTEEEIAAKVEAARVAAIPSSVSPRQIRQALTASGLRSSVEAAVAAGDQDIKDWWEYSTTFDRVNPQVTAMAQALNVTERQLDDLWTLAASL